MCNRRARYKVRARISEFFRKIIRTYRQRAGCLVTKKDAAGNLSILLIQGMNKRKNSHLVYKMPGMFKNNFNTLNHLKLIQLAILREEKREISQLFERL